VKKRPQGTKRSVGDPVEKIISLGTRRPCWKPCKNEAKGNPVIKEASGNYVEKRSRWNKKTGGAPCKRNS
jgi:hypothetical protein